MFLQGESDWAPQDHTGCRVLTRLVESSAPGSVSEKYLESLFLRKGKRLSVDKYGCHVISAALTCASSVIRQAAETSVLPCVRDLALNRTGSLVAEAALSTSAALRADLLADAAYMIGLSKSRYGRHIERCLHNYD